MNATSKLLKPISTPTETLSSATYNPLLEPDRALSIATAVKTSAYNSLLEPDRAPSIATPVKTSAYNSLLEPDRAPSIATPVKTSAYNSLLEPDRAPSIATPTKTFTYNSLLEPDRAPSIATPLMTPCASRNSLPQHSSAPLGFVQVYTSGPGATQLSTHAGLSAGQVAGVAGGASAALLLVGAALALGVRFVHQKMSASSTQKGQQMA